MTLVIPSYNETFHFLNFASTCLSSERVDTHTLWSGTVSVLRVSEGHSEPHASQAHTARLIEISVISLAHQVQIHHHRRQ